MIWIPIALAGVVVVIVSILLGLAWTSARPPRSAAAPGRLAPCPSSPNCVCSTADPDDAEHFVEPIAAHGSAEGTLRRIRDLIESDARARIVESTDGSLHAVFTTPWLRFRDDVEFLVDPERDVVHVRSASRVGHSDLGANRARVERLRRRLSAGE
jgi:uncharacterized protein (DUF1499 family)